MDAVFLRPERSLERAYDRLARDRRLLTPGDVELIVADGGACVLVDSFCGWSVSTRTS